MAGAGTTYLYVRNASGTNVASFSSDGTVVFASRCVFGENAVTGDISIGEIVQITNCQSPPANSFQIKNGSQVTSWISYDGVFCTEGDIINLKSPYNFCDGTTFNITDNTLTTQACWNSTGTFTSKGTITCGTCGANCGAGVCSALGICETLEDCDNNNDCISNSCTASTCV